MCKLVQLRQASDGEREVKASCSTQRVWMPRIVRAGAENAGNAGRGCDAHARTHVAEIARILEQDHRRCAERLERVARSHGRALGERHHAGARRQRRELREHLGVHLPGRGADLLGHVRRKRRREAGELRAVARDHLEHHGAEAERVLERVKAFEDGQRGIATGPPEARDQRAILHGRMIARVTRGWPSAELRRSQSPRSGIRWREAVRLEGIHHISAITGDAPGNVRFYTGVLGLRMVKRTVNQDDPSVYHLFYGDELGSPGMDLTFFEYPGAPPGTAGGGMVHRIVWRVGSADSLRFWQERLRAQGVECEMTGDSLLFADPEGLGHELLVSVAADEPLSASSPEIPPEHALQGFEGVRAYASNPVGSERLLGDTLGFGRHQGERWEVRGERRGGIYAYDRAPPEINRRQGAGSVHHVAFAALKDDLHAWRLRLLAASAHPTPVIDRYYFQSVYFREPSGVLFEIATIGPGFAVDEDPEHLGERLSLPPQFEAHREQLEQTLAPLPYPPSWRLAASG